MEDFNPNPLRRLTSLFSKGNNDLSSFKDSTYDQVKSISPVKNEQLSNYQPRADYFGGGTYRSLFSYPFDGEKNLGELGAPKNYRPNYAMLNVRSWQSFLESEITQTVISRYTNWVIGGGLKLQAEPIEKILEQANIKIDKEEFCNQIEPRFTIFREDKSVDYSGMETLDELAVEAFKNSILGGDVLVILRLIDNQVTIQLVDGIHVQSPLYGTELFPYVLSNGNKIINGIEFDGRRKAVAYYVRNFNDPLDYFKTTRIEAYSQSTGLQTAYLVKGLKYRRDTVRGIPLISAVMETLKKLERYKEATVGSAEERQKIPYFIEHGITSTGENPMTNRMVKAHDVDAPYNDNIPRDINGKELANTIAVSTQKTVVNMPNDSTIKALESKLELNFKEFYTPNVDLVCATLQIPPEVAMSKYDSNFSSARAAIKDWEHTLIVRRKFFKQSFYQPIFNLWLHVQILMNKVDAPGYISAVASRDSEILGAYRYARFVGAPVPHIDPLKEVAAERLKLGDTGNNLPLTTMEAATEALNGGEANSNMIQYSKELEKSKELEIIAEPIPMKGSGNNPPAEKEEKETD